MYTVSAMLFVIAILILVILQTSEMYKQCLASPFECEVCQKRFKQAGHLERHLRIHSGEKPFACELCKKRFNQEGALKRHLRIHSREKPFACEHCKKRFNQGGALKRHLRIHSSQKAFECELCKKSFNQEGALKRHLRIHSGEKPFACELCKKRFNQEGALKRHLRIHSSQKAFECEICKKCFNREGALKRHLRIHSGERPFACELCKKCFNREEALKRHLRTHSSQKAFECEICKKRFNREEALKRHLRIHSGEKPGVDYYNRKFVTIRENQMQYYQRRRLIQKGQRASRSKLLLRLRKDGNFSGYNSFKRIVRVQACLKSVSVKQKKKNYFRKRQDCIAAERLVAKASNRLRMLFSMRKRELAKLREKVRHAVQDLGTDYPLANLLGKRSHYCHSDAYFWESSFHSLSEAVGSDCLAVDERGVVHFETKQPEPSEQLLPKNKSESDENVNKLGFDDNGERPCNALCNLCDKDLMRLKDFYNVFVKSLSDNAIMKFLNKSLHDCGVCKNDRYRGHSLACIRSKQCNSIMRSLRALQTHSGGLREVVRVLYAVMRYQNWITDLNGALEEGNRKNIISILEDLSKKLSCCTEGSVGVQEVSEVEVMNPFAEQAEAYKEKIIDFPEVCCCSCERMFYESQMVKNIPPHFENKSTWKTFIGQVPFSNTRRLCRYCYDKFKNNQLPNRCVTNGLVTDPLPDCLKGLNMLESILIQKGKCFETVLRLGTVTSRRPSNELLKAVKGCIIHLPLPLEATVNSVLKREKSDKLHILVNGVPTKKKEIWQNLVNLEKVTTAICELKKINPLYEDVHVQTVEELESELALEATSAAEKPLLIPVSPGELYESFTIHPLQINRPEASDVSLYQMLRAEGEKLDNEKSTDLLCFPLLYPTGKYGKWHQRDVKLSDAEFVKSRLLNIDARYRRDHQYLFHLLWDSELRGLANGIFHTLRSTKFRNMSAAQFVNNVEGKEQSIQVDLGTVFANVRGTKQYWNRRTCEAMGMVREFGAPTWFLTLSCAEYYWPDLDEYLRKINSDIDGVYSTTALCVADPVSVMRHFQHRFDAMFDFIRRAKPLGEVQHWFWRLEYQSRGAPHLHILLWIKDAPVIGQSNAESVISFIEKHVTCRLPNNEKNPLLHELVTKFQTHLCSSYCLKRYKTARNRFVSRCKFGFPRRITEHGVLRDPIESIKSRKSGKNAKRLYDVPRRVGEEKINDYNPVILLMWQANIDIQYIADDHQSVCQYVTKYVTKHEKTSLGEVWEEITESETLVKRLWKFVFRMLQSRECGAYEAATRLVGIPLYGKSVSVKYVNVRMPQHRTKRLKSYAQIQKQKEECPESVDIYENNWIDDYYPNRPDVLEDLCFYDFVRHHDYVSKVNPENQRLIILKNDKGALHLRQKPHIINHKMYKPNNENERESYFFSILFLFRPWRNDSELLGDYSSYEDAFRKQVVQLKALDVYHGKLTNIREAEEALNRELEKDFATSPAHAEIMASDNQFAQGVALETGVHRAMDDLYNVMLEDSPEDLDILLTKMNADQKRVIEKIRSSISLSNCSPLRMFVSGVGGTGKSYLIHGIKRLVENIFPNEGIVVAIACPTGLSAFQVKGVTIHKLFQLPVEHGKTTEYKPLADEALKHIKSSLKNLKLLILDEVSMVSNLMLLYIHLRLQEIFSECSDWFGGRSVIVFGDLLQLKPVRGDPVWSTVKGKIVTEKIGGATSVNLWQDLFEYDELTINMRQKDDEMFQRVLNTIRVGQIDEQASSLIGKRVYKNGVYSVEECCLLYNKCLDKGISTVCLFPTNAMCQELNHAMLSKLPSPIVKLNAVDAFSFRGKKNAKKFQALEQKVARMNGNASDTAGLESELHLAVGARIMLRRNIEIEKGLVNGVMGTINGFKEKVGGTEIDSISIMFDEHSQEVDIKPISVKFEVALGVYVERQQFPVVLAYAITVHKSQGLTVDGAIIHLGREVFSNGMAYVALSRVKRFENVHICQLHLPCIQADKGNILEYNRLRAKFCPHLPQYSVPNKVKRSSKTAAVNNLPRKKFIRDVVVADDEKRNQKPSTHRERKRFRESNADLEGLTLRKKIVRCEVLPEKEKISEVHVHVHSISRRRRGFSNPVIEGMKVSCYANASLACLYFQSAVIRLFTLNFPDPLISRLKEGFDNFISEGVNSLTSWPVRRAVGGIFLQNEMQDAEEFISAILNRIPVCELFKHDYRIDYSCCHENCGESWFTVNSRLFYGVPLPTTDDTVTFEELFGCRRVEVRCPKCDSSEKVVNRERLVYVGEHLLLQLARYDYASGNKINTKVSNFRGRNVNIDGFHFKCSGAVLHTGNNREGGHYISYVFDDDINSWIEYDDEVVSPKSRFVQNLKDVYLLFLTKCLDKTCCFSQNIKVFSFLMKC